MACPVQELPPAWSPARQQLRSRRSDARFVRVSKVSEGSSSPLWCEARTPSACNSALLRAPVDAALYTRCDPFPLPLTDQPPSNLAKASITDRSGFSIGSPG